MLQADELHQLSPGLWLWQAFDPSVKADLFSTALLTRDGLFLIDPIPLAAPARKELVAGRNLAAVCVTNANHLRDAGATAEEANAPILAAEAVLPQIGSVRSRKVAGGEEVAPGVTVVALEGAAEGEIALCCAEDGGTVVVGDALINLEPYGFALLPAKYCANQKHLRRSLRQLLDFRFERLCFAHGLPLLNAARARLEALLR
jgi:glyoxylase-like metal-dependent hydrolase (beta-lactamase superfamily II)